MNYQKEIRNIARFQEIATVLIKEGFGYYLSKITPKLPQPKGKYKNPIKPERRFRRTLEQLGPTFIKLGQILSLRPDLVPKRYVKELSKLQDDVPEFPYEQARATIEKELKKPLPQLFKSFTKKPIAAASIAQVHKATLPNGQEVAVKVQRPHIKNSIKTDIEIMYAVARYLEKHHEGLKRYRPSSIVKEFEEWTLREIDFRQEARNARKFRNNAKNVTTLVIPKVYNRYSTDKVLTLEFIKGVELHQLPNLKNKKKYNIKKIVQNGFDMTLRQVFEDGFFHGDPHPGNILVLPHDRIALVDFGIVGHFTNDLKKQSIKLLYGIVNNNMELIVDVFLEMGLMNKVSTNKELFKNDLRKVVEPLQHQSLKEARISAVLEEVLDIALYHQVRMPVDFILFGKTILTIEGLGLAFEPDFKLIETVRPVAERLIKKEFKSGNMVKDVKKELITYKRFFSELPNKINAALDKVQRGTVKVDIDDTDVKKLSRDINTSSNRLSYGLIIAALLVTGALTQDTSTPIYAGFPLVSLISFGIAALLAVALFVSIMKEGNN